MEVSLPQVAVQFVARFAENVVAVTVPLIFKANVEVARVAPHGQISERICEQFVEVPVQQVAEQIVGVPKSVDITQKRVDETHRGADR